MRYVLDPEDVFGPDFPGETFRVQKEKEEKHLGEYRTKRLVLAAFDELSISGRFQGENGSAHSPAKLGQWAISRIGEGREARQWLAENKWFAEVARH